MTGAGVPDGPVAMTTLTPHGFKRNDRSTASRGATMAGCETTRATKRTARCEFWSMKSIQIHLYWRLSRKILTVMLSLNSWGHVFSGDKSLITIDRRVFWRQNAAGRSRCAATSLVPGWSPKIAGEWMVIPMNNMIILVRVIIITIIIIIGFDPSPYLQPIRNTMNFNVPWEYHGNSTADHESLTLGCFNYAYRSSENVPTFELVRIAYLDVPARMTKRWLLSRYSYDKL